MVRPIVQFNRAPFFSFIPILQKKMPGYRIYAGNTVLLRPHKIKSYKKHMKNFTFTAKHFFIAAVVAVSVSFLAFGPKGSLKKVTVCHIPPGNPGNCHEIEVSINALQAHLDHGDNLVCNNEEEYD